MDAISEIDIGSSLRAKHDRRSLGGPAPIGLIPVTGHISFRTVTIGFCFYNDAAQAPAIKLSNQNLTE